MPPLVTIGITCHNAERTIERALRSALQQNWQNVEVVIVDDHSTDESWAILTARAAQESRIRIFQHQHNLGVAEARNSIVRHARGDFICFADDDDVSMPTRVSEQLARIVSYEASQGTSLILCYCNRYVTTDGVHRTLAGAPIGSTPPEPQGSIVADFVLGLPVPDRVAGWGLMGAGTMMARKSSLLLVGTFEPSFRREEEQDLSVRAALMGAHFISVDRPLITQYKTQSEDKSGMKPLQYALMLRDKHRDYLDQRGLYHASRMFARSNYWGNKKHRLKSRFYRALGYALAPQLIPAYLKRRSGGAE